MKTYYFIIHETKYGADLLFMTSDLKKFEKENKKAIKQYGKKALSVGAYDVED